MEGMRGLYSFSLKLNKTICPAQKLCNALTLFSHCLQKESGCADTSQKESAGGDLNDRNRKAEQLLSDHGDSILRLAYSYMHNMPEAEDILQETFIRYLKTQPAFENEAHERAWLLKVAANLAKNQLESKKRCSEMPLVDSLCAGLSENGENELSFLWEAVKKLPQRYRSVIHLFYYEGYTTRQIGTILQLNESTVRSHLKRGRAILKKILKEEYDFA